MIWNSLDSVVAQALVTVHHIMLKAFAGPELHGMFASYVSIIYTFIPFFNLGFDYSLSPYLKDFIQTKKNFLSLVLFQFLPQLAFTCLAAHLISQPFFYNAFFTSTITAKISFWLKWIFIVEYIRKSARSFLQLMLYTEATAIVEILGTFLYMATFWILAWMLNWQLSLLMAFKLLALSSSLQTVILCIRSIKIFLSLDPNSTHLTNTNLTSAHQGMTQTRMGIWANHLVSQINYSNFVVPFSSACFGPAQASALAILMNSARCVKLFFQKGLGVSSLALLSQPNSHENTSKDTMYSYPMYYLYNLSVPLLIFFFLNSSKLSYLFSDKQIVWHLVSLACFLSVIEGAISVYEKFYIAEKRMYLFSVLNSIASIILFVLAYKFLIFTSLTQFFLFFFIIRTAVLIVIITLSHYFLKFSPIPSFNYYILSAATLFSVLFYLLF